MKSLVEGPVIAAVVSVIASMVMCAMLPKESSARVSGAIGLAAGFLVAFARVEPQNLLPTHSWHWVLWLIVFSAMIGPIGLASGVTAIEHWMLTIALAFAAAWFLVPTRALSPSRTTYILVVAGAVIIWWMLADRIRSPTNVAPLAIALFIASLAASVLVADATSLRMGTLGAIAAAGLCGGSILAFWKRDNLILRGLLGSIAISLASLVLSAQLNDGPTLPLTSIVLSPLALVLFEFGPQAKWISLRGAVAKGIAVSVPLLIGIALYFFPVGK